MGRKYIPPVLTPVEFAVYEDQREFQRKTPQCHRCVNGFKMLGLWGCDNGLRWPKCKNVPNGGFELKQHEVCDA